MKNFPNGPIGPTAAAPPPGFDEARNQRQKVRAAGLDPNHWYVVARERDLAPGQTREVVFWKRSIALYRGDDGQYRAIENRCAHRQLKLTHGVVEGCNLVCQYHGWAYDGDGSVVRIPHERFGHDKLRVCVPSYAVQVRYGLVWLFPGDLARAASVPLPEIPELEEKSGWIHITCEFDWAAHHSMVLDNICDYTHEYLHRKTRPFQGARQLSCEAEGDSVRTAYRAQIAASPLMNLFIDRGSGRVSSGIMQVDYEYPYGRSNTDDHIKHFLSMVPVDEGHTRFFIIFMFRSFRIPLTRLPLPAPAMKVAGLVAWLMARRVFAEDQTAVEWELEAYRDHWDAPLVELNPQVKACQRLTIRKWEEYLRAGSEAAREATR